MARELKTQIPGDVLGTSIKPVRDPLLELAALPSAKLIPVLRKLTESELLTLVGYECAGRKRESVLAAVEATMRDLGAHRAAPVAQLQRAVEPRPAFGGMVLTDAGYVVQTIAKSA